MNNIWMPNDQIYWYFQNKKEQINQLKKNIVTEVAIIGGGMAGLSAAQEFAKKGKKVVLLEQYFCGAGASGKSSGFITPNAEVSLTDFIKRYGKNNASKIWNFITSGVEDIRRNILDYKINCDYFIQDTLEVTDKRKDLEILKKEYENLLNLGFKTSFFEKNDLHKLLNSSDYIGGVCYENSFAINGFLYCQEMKRILQRQGVEIFEETPVILLEGHTLKAANNFQINAEYIIFGMDYRLPQLGFLKQQIYHAQTYLLVSQPLSKNEVLEIFPQNKSFMVWDTDLIYNYFRLTGNKRLLVGGGSLLTTYSSKLHYDYKPILLKLKKYINKKFPSINFNFEYQWPGLIGISKDIAPIMGRDKDKPYIYYISACAGLPIAAAAGKYTVQNIIDERNDLRDFFSPYRYFPISGILQSVLGNKISFAISNAIVKNVP